jgi:hypothetical protein
MGAIQGSSWALTPSTEVALPVAAGLLRMRAAGTPVGALRMLAIGFKSRGGAAWSLK